MVLLILNKGFHLIFKYIKFKCKIIPGSFVHEKQKEHLQKEYNDGKMDDLHFLKSIGSISVKCVATNEARKVSERDEEVPLSHLEKTNDELRFVIVCLILCDLSYFCLV